MSRCIGELAADFLGWWKRIDSSEFLVKWTEHLAPARPLASRAAEVPERFITIEEFLDEQKTESTTGDAGRIQIGIKFKTIDFPDGLQPVESDEIVESKSENTANPTKLLSTPTYF